MPISVFSDSIASGAATSTGVSLCAGMWITNLQVGTMSTSAQIQVWASHDSGSSYYQVFNNTINTSTVATQAYLIASSVGTNGGIVNLPPGLLNLRFVTTGVVSGGVNFKVVCVS